MRNEPASSRGNITMMIAVLALLAGVASPTTTAAELPAHLSRVDLKALQDAFVELSEEVRPSCVAIRTYTAQEPQEGRPSRLLRPHSQGSGFILGSGGTVATNRHVVHGADMISVVLHDGIKYDATLVKSDLRSDLAVLKIDAADVVPVRLGDQASVQVHQWVFTCGNPFGLANSDGRTSMTFGVVSALGRQMTPRLARGEDEYYGNMIETSATINPGNSGGPLFNLDGEVVGIVTAIETSTGVSEGLGFAIPLNRNTRRILELLQNGQDVRYGFLGVKVSDVDPVSPPFVVDVATTHGAVLQELLQTDGPAARAGLRPKDILIEFDGTPVENSDHLVRLVGFTPVGSQVQVTFLRNGVRRKASVTIGDRWEILSRADSVQ